RISSPKTTRDSGPVRWRSHHQRWRWSAPAGGRETHRDPVPVCCLLHRLSESRSDRTSGGGDGGPEGLWSGPGIRRSERSRGVAERSLVGGVGGEGGSRQSSLSRKEHPESAGTDPRDGQSEGALQKDRAGSRSFRPSCEAFSEVISINFPANAARFSKTTSIFSCPMISRIAICSDKYRLVRKFAFLLI